MRSGKLPSGEPYLAEVLKHLWLAYHGIELLPLTEMPRIWTDTALVFMGEMADRSKTQEGTTVTPIGEGKFRKTTVTSLI